MKKSEIKVGGLYVANVSGKRVTVRVDKIYVRSSWPGPTAKDVTVYDVTNLSTKRTTTFRSAQRFLRPVTTNEESPPKTSPLGSSLRAGSKKNEAPHVIVEARAGTGKTTTLVEGLKILKGIGSKLTPSLQQQAVWDAIAQSKDAKTVCFVAFNKSIATELQQRVPSGCDAMTMHSLGFRAVQQSLGRQEPNSFVVQDIISELLERDIRDLRRTRPVVLKATEQLVSLCKMNLVGIGAPPGSTDGWAEQLADLAAYYEIDLNGQSAEVFDLVPRVLERCKNPKGRINFDDMIWLPVVLNLPVQRYDLLLVDESQDLNRCQQSLAKMAGKRLILCGDPKQAIYGFAGADADSMARLEQELGATDVGCLHLPLTVTRRCGKAIVAEANRFVPEFSAHESNPEGKVATAGYKPCEGPRGEVRDYTGLVHDGDMILSRVNAPLVSQCFRFIRQGRKANIQGRDVGQGLVSTIKRCLGAKDEAELSGRTVNDLIAGIGDWLHKEQEKENAKRNPSEARLIALGDRYDCIVAFTEGSESVAQVVKKINDIFTDDKNGSGIKLSSIHKAKGLESRRVFFLQCKDSPCPHPMAKSAWEREQEQNLCYVAITRAIEELVYVTD